MKKNINTEYTVYILECNDGTFYTGITTDIKRRLHEHNYTSAGAKYTKTRRPCKLVYTEHTSGKSTAAKREYEIKKMSHIQKKQLTKTQPFLYQINTE